MIPRIASALARILEPIAPIARPGQSITLNKSAGSDEGGYSPPGQESAKYPPDSNSENLDMASESQKDPTSEATPSLPSLGFQPGLTQVILDLSKQRPPEPTSGNVVHSYESGAKDQKKNAKLPKGSMLDRKVG